MKRNSKTLKNLIFILRIIFIKNSFLAAKTKLLLRIQNNQVSYFFKAGNLTNILNLTMNDFTAIKS